MSKPYSIVGTIYRRLFWLIVSAYWLGLLAWHSRTGEVFFLEIAKDTGWLAWYLLVYVVFVSLLQRGWPNRWTALLLSQRKQAGVLAFLIATCHAVANTAHRLFLSGRTLSEYLDYAFGPENTVILGIIGYLFLLPAMATSTAWAARKLGFGKWKLLQRLVHIAFVVIGLHIALIGWFFGRTPNRIVIFILALYAMSYVIVLGRLEKAAKRAGLTVAALMIAAGSLLLPLAASAQPGSADGSGSLEIFEQIGQERPAEWMSWDRDTRHDYWKAMGILPGPDGKYSGKVSDLTPYFEWLGIEEPDGWDDMNFEERQFVVAEARSEIASPAQPEAERTIAPTGAPAGEAAESVQPEKKNPWSKMIKLILSAVAGGIIIIYMSHQVDGLRKKIAQAPKPKQDGAKNDSDRDSRPKRNRE